MPSRAMAEFPRMKQLCDEVHGLGLKIGIYSTPWITSYAGFCGGSSDDAKGAWSWHRPGRNPTGATGPTLFSKMMPASGPPGALTI